MPRKPKTDGENAISLRSAHRTLAPWLRPDPFPPIPPEGEYDWPRGKGQTFDDYVAANPSKPSAPADGTTYRRANSGGIKIPGTVNKQRQGYGRYKIYLQVDRSATRMTPFPTYRPSRRDAMPSSACRPRCCR